MIEQEAKVSKNRELVLKKLENFLATIKIGRCKYCKIEMSTGGSTLADANGWHCPKCKHEEIEMGSYSLGGRNGPILNCKCQNCLKTAKEKKHAN